MNDLNCRPIPWGLFVSELIGTAFLVLIGLSLVILMFGTGSPMASLIPSEGLRHLITGFIAKHVEVAKLYYFNSDHDRLFRRMVLPRQPDRETGP